MYSIRRMSARGGNGTTTPPLGVSIALQNVAAMGSLPEGGAHRSSTGSIPSTPVPIPLSAGPLTPQLLMASPALDPVEPRRNLVLNLIVVRHAETDLNARRPRVVQGHHDTPLNAKGMKQALLLSHRLSHLPVDYIYSSDLLRSRQTAEEIARPHNKPVLLDPRLREQHLGDLTGQPWSSAKARLKQADLNYEEYLAAHGGEASATVKERVVESYIDVVEKHLLAPNRIALPRSGSNLLLDTYGPATPATAAPPASRAAAAKVCTVVLVTHGGPIKHLVQHVVEDLGFTYHPKVLAGCGKRQRKSGRAPAPRRGRSPRDTLIPHEPRMTQFPRCSAVFHVRLTRRYAPATAEYDWTGHVVSYNCTAHLGAYKAWNLVDAATGANVTAMTAIASGGSDGPRYKLAKVKLDPKAAAKGAKKGLTETEIGKGGARAIGARMFGKFIGGGVIAGGQAPAAASGVQQGDKRNKSLGW
ncbi:hypothetical protein H9P43_003621 [Blastocladiella emersonii ATCC 22665]|nr:hypothetical protein H9P43_003621 [Blastocladiella emersonii ATCC 22665]